MQTPCRNPVGWFRHLAAHWDALKPPPQRLRRKSFRLPGKQRARVVRPYSWIEERAAGTRYGESWPESALTKQFGNIISAFRVPSLRSGFGETHPVCRVFLPPRPSEFPEICGVPECLTSQPADYVPFLLLNSRSRRRTSRRDAGLMMPAGSGGGKFPCLHDRRRPRSSARTHGPASALCRRRLHRRKEGWR